MRDRVSRGSGAVALLLVEFVVEEHVLVPVALCPPALVAVRGAGVGEAGEDFRGRVAVFLGGVVDGEGIFVVADADVAAAETAVRAVVGYALRVVDVAVLAGAAGGGGLGGVREVDVLEAGGAGLVARLRADGEDVLVVPVDDDVVGTSDGELVPETNEVLLGVECDRALGINIKKLLHVKD